MLFYKNYVKETGKYIDIDDVYLQFVKYGRKLGKFHQQAIYKDFRTSKLYSVKEKILNSKDEITCRVHDILPNPIVDDYDTVRQHSMTYHTPSNRLMKDTALIKQAEKYNKLWRRLNEEVRNPAHSRLIQSGIRLWHKYEKIFHISENTDINPSAKSRIYRLEQFKTLYPSTWDEVVKIIHG
jgi:hypothetical protein